MSARLWVPLFIAALAASASAGIDRGGITRGLLESVDPLVVGGTEFDTSRASVQANGVPVSVYHLKPGQIVSVTSTFDDGAIANAIDCEVTLRGAIEQAGAEELMLLGQRVRIDSETIVSVLQPDPIGGTQQTALLPPGLRVDVSAFELPDGSWRATRIDLAEPGHDRVRGVAVAPDGGEFGLGGMRVDYSIAKLFGFAEPPHDGDYVMVQGKIVAPGLLRAIAVTRRAPLAGAPDTEADIEGYITRFESSDDFDVDGIRIRSAATTSYTGAGAAALGVGVFVEVDGVFNDVGAIVAEHLAIDEADEGGDD